MGQAILSLLFPLYALALIYLDRSLPAHFRMSLPVKAALLFCFLLFTGVWVYVAVVG